MKKKLTMLITCLSLLAQISIIPPAASASTTSTVIEGKLTNSGRVLLPLRSFSEHLGAVVDWNNKEKKVNITFNDKVIDIALNGVEVGVNGIYVGMLDMPMKMFDGVTYLPISFIGSILGGEMNWDNKLKQASVVYNERSLLINGKIDSKIQLPTAPSKQRVKELYAKVKVAANITQYAQKRQQLKGYFTDELINKVIQNKGLTEYDKLYADQFSEPYLIYSKPYIYHANIYQEKGMSDKDPFYPDWLSRTIHLQYVDGKWLIYDISTNIVMFRP